MHTLHNIWMTGLANKGSFRRRVILRVAVQAVGIALLVFPAPHAYGQFTWTAAANTTWSTTDVNWVRSTGTTAWVSGTNAVFDATAPAESRTVTVAGSQSVFNLTVSSTGYVFNNGTLAISAINSAWAINSDATVNSTVASSVGQLVKNGSATLTLAGNVSLNSLTHGFINVSGGTLAQTSGTLTLGRSGTVGSAALFIGNQGTGAFSASGGALRTTGTGVPASLAVGQGFSGTLTVNGGPLGFAGTRNLIGGTTGSVVGTINLQSGELALNNLAKGTGSAAFNFSGGTLRPFDANTTFGSTTSGSNFTITLSSTGATMSGLDQATGTARTVDVYTPLTGSGGMTFSGGSVNLRTANTYTGRTTVTGGTLALASGASLASSLITVGTAAASTSAYLDVSALSGGLTPASNQTIDGRGTILGNMIVGGGATVSPGNSTGLLTQTGAVTFASGGRYTFEINNAAGTAGSSSGWDLFDVGSLSVTATALNPFSVDLVTLTSSQTPGLADGFDPNGTYYWLFLDAGSAITTWNAAAFQVNATGFQNPTSNLFTVVRGDGSGVGGTDQQLYIAYIGVPEPGSLSLAGIGIAAGGWALYRRRHNRRQESTERP
jgi:autotransporter-associated beta strand protein